jgi:hypothetical protein
MIGSGCASASSRSFFAQKRNFIVAALFALEGEL